MFVKFSALVSLEFVLYACDQGCRHLQVQEARKGGYIFFFFPTNNICILLEFNAYFCHAFFRILFAFK